MLNALSSETRIEILKFIKARGQATTPEIIDAFGFDKSKASRELNTLRSAGLIHETKGEGPTKVYRFNAPRLEMLKGLLDETIS